jgi:hypothetical protein
MGNNLCRSAVVSRRAILRNAALTVGGAAILATNASGNPAAAQTKLAQKAVSYQDTPKGAARCDNCKQFAAPSSCKIVDGTIQPSGWCTVYVKNPA